MDNKNRKAINIYDNIAEEYSKNYDSIDGEEDLIFLKTFILHLHPNSHIVDIGCGTGFSAGWFVNKGMKAEGSDFSSSMINISRRNYPDIPFSVADMRTWKSTKPADAVWAGYSMFHFDQSDFEKTIENIKTYLKPSGIFGLVMQEGQGEVEVPEPFLPNETIYIHLYSEDELINILRKYGFEILEQKRKIPQHSNEFSYNKLLIIAKAEN